MLKKEIGLQNYVRIAEPATLFVPFIYPSSHLTIMEPMKTLVQMAS